MINFYNSLAASARRSLVFLGNIATILLISISFLLSTGCEEDPSRIGGSILPGDDFNNIVASDTFGVDLYTMFTDTIRSTLPSTSYIGVLNDQVFGKTEAGCISQLWLLSNWYETGLNSIDSVFFYLKINGVLQSSDEESTLNVYETDEIMSSDSVYYVSRDVPVKDLLFSVNLSGITKDSLLRFRIPNTVGEYLLSDTTTLFLSNDSADFREFFPGLYFELSSLHDNELYSIDLLSGASGLSIYYQNAALTSTNFSFTLNSKCVRYNRFIHDFTTADPDKKINHINDMVKDTLSYVQSFQGVYTRVEIPGLEDLKSTGLIGINKASLTFPAFINDDYYPEENLVSVSILARYNDIDGAKTIVPDYSVGAEFFDGIYNALDKSFTINILNFVQAYLDGEIPEPVIEIFLPSNVENNLILRSNSSVSKPGLELVYTVIDNK